MARDDEMSIFDRFSLGGKTLYLHLTSTFLCTKFFGGAMIQRGNGGRVINIASISGMIANRGIGGRSYETSKAAVIQFTRATATDWASQGGYTLW